MPRLQSLVAKPHLWLVLVVGFNLLYFFAEHEALYYYDDYNYSLYAYQILNQGFSFDGSPFCHRWMVFLPTALFYAFLGVNPYSSTLWPFLCTIGTYLLIYFTFYKRYPFATSWILVLLGLYYFLLHTTNYLYPDNIALFFSTAIFLILFKIRNPLPAVKNNILLGVLFASANFLFFLTKETILYAFPFYICVFAYHFRKRQNRWFWVAFGLVSGLLIVSYFAFYYTYTGNPFLRIHDIEAYSSLFKKEYLAHQRSTLWARLTYQPLFFFIASGLVIPLAFAATAVFTKKRLQITNLQQPLSFWFLAACSMLVSIWFGSVSLDHYKPISLLPRMFHPLLPAFCILAGLSITNMWEYRPTHLLLTIIFLLATLMTPSAMKVMYAPLFLLFAISYIARKRISHITAIIVTAAVLCIRPVYFILKPSVSSNFEQASIIKKYLQNSSGRYLVITDNILSRTYSYFYGFEAPPNYIFVSFNTFKSTFAAKADTTFLLINSSTLENPEHKFLMREKEVLEKFPQAVLKAQDGKVKLYTLPKDGTN